MGKIQRRLVRIPQPSPPRPTIHDLVEASPHNLVSADGACRCLDCSSISSQGSAGLRQWFASACNPFPFDDSERPSIIPSWFVIKTKNVIPHSSHNLMSAKGVTFCHDFGAYVVKRCRLFAQPCTRQCTVSSERARSTIRYQCSFTH